MLWTAAAAVAQPHDAGPVDAAPPDAIAPMSERNIALFDETVALQQLTFAIESLADTDIAPPVELARYLDVDTSVPDAVAQRIAAFDQELAAIELELQHAERVRAALEAQWGEGHDAGAVEAESIEYATFDRDLAAARLAWTKAMRQYLSRTQPARTEAYTEADAHERAEVAEKLDAEEKLRVHVEAEAIAIAKSESAETAADKILNAEEARLAKLGADQADFQSQLSDQRTALGKMLTEADNFRTHLELLSYDEQYDAVEWRLRGVRLHAIEDTFELFSTPSVPGPGSKLGAAVRALPSSFGPRVAILERDLNALRVEAAVLRVKATQILSDRAAFYVRQADELNAILVDLLGRVSSGKRNTLTGLTGRATVALRGEATQVAVDLVYWAHTRWYQAKHLGELYDWGSAWVFAVKVIEIALMLLILQFVVRRWDSWMLGVVDSIGGSVAAGGTTLFFARLADAARGFGPSMLSLAIAVLAYHRLGGASAPPEVQIAYIFVFWMALLRFQLRVAERIAAAMRIQAAERARLKAEEEREAADAEADLDPTKSVPENHAAQPDGAVEPEQAATLFSKTWRVGTAYVAVIFIVRGLAEFAVGRGVFHSFVTRFAWWGALPLAVYFLRAWRPRIVHEYVQWSPKAGALSELAEAHSHRFYGVFILALVFVVIVARRIARFFQRQMMGLVWIRAIKAVWTRSRVEKHGRHGRVLENPPDLPPDIITQFPVGPIGPEERPVRTPPLETIKEMFESWKKDKSDGSVVLVGEAGMGKSTILNQLEVELGEPVMHGRLLTKITHTKNLAGTLARILDLPGEGDISSESELVSAVFDEERRVIALDNCHNLFLRKVGGFQAWEAFTRIVNETCDNVFWVLTFNDTSWEYLNDVAERVSYFRRVIHVPPWTDEQLRRLVLTRMRRAKYRPNFTNLLVTRLEGVKTSTQIIRTSKGYFRLLWDFTDGNPRLATHFWMRSLVPEVDKRRASVHLFAAPKVESLEKLPDDLAFVLTAVVEHENITPAELAETSNMSIEFCRFALRLCRERGYLWRNPTTGRVALSMHWQKTIVRYLTRKGFLYS